MSATCITAESAGSGEFMLFGVRVVVDAIRKSVSMNNLSQYEHPQDVSGNSNLIEDAAAAAAGYASADEAVHHNSGAKRERKRGMPWTEEEHKLFLLGLQKVGKGDWRGISRNFVKTRTPTQVASHAQKYFLRRSNLSRRRRRSSLFDITTDSVTALPMDENQVQHLDNVCQSRQLQTINHGTINMGGFPLLPTPTVVACNVTVPVENPMANLSLSQENLSPNDSIKLVRAVPVSQNAKASMVLVAESSLYTNSAFDLEPLSLKLSLASEPRATPSRNVGFQAMPCFRNRDSIINVA